jgi:two-component system OmpR family sensor kinase
VVTAEGNAVAPAGAAPVPTKAELGRVGDEFIVNRSVPGVGGRARVLLRRVKVSGGAERVVVVAGSTAPVRRAQERLAVVLGVAGPIMVLTVAGMAWLLTGAALRPVSRMTRQAATISFRDADARLPQPPGRDEIAELGWTINRMLDRIAATVAHERAFVDDASHELRTPLAVLRSELELARLEIADGPTAARTITAIDSALEETDRLAVLTERLLVLARADVGHLVGPAEPVPVGDVVRRVVEHVDPSALTIDVRIGDVAVVGDRVALDQLVTNLVTNATRWAHRRVQVEAARVGSDVVLVVADDGPGFDPVVLEHAFDRFSRADAARGRTGGGAGLGLAIVAAIAGALGGRAVAGNGPPLGGAWVAIQLPAVVGTTGPARTG